MLDIFSELILLFHSTITRTWNVSLAILYDLVFSFFKINSTLLIFSYLTWWHSYINCGLSVQILTWAAVYSYVCPVDLAPYVLCWLWQGDQGLRGPAGNPGKEGPKVSRPKSEIREENRVIGRHMSPRYVHSLPFSCNSGSTFPLLQQGIAGQMYYKWCNNYSKKWFAYCTLVHECETFSDRWELRPEISINNVWEHPKRETKSRECTFCLNDCPSVSLSYREWRVREAFLVQWGTRVMRWVIKTIQQS